MDFLTVLALFWNQANCNPHHSCHFESWIMVNTFTSYFNLSHLTGSDHKTELSNGHVFRKAMFSLR